ncbi:MAG: DUF72 domain-containing protein [Chloroflexi bacterium]|nr:DUF72 domain-containing protein [Chloroflexota bacterium]
MSELRIGTSGWIYRHWRGVFYPEGLPQREWLEFYAQHFDTVEVNFTFYRLPGRETFEAWQRRAPPGFCYAVKGSRFITHLKRLLEPEPHVALFFERLAGLGDRVGPVLWQLPPDFRRDDERLERFLAALPRTYQHTLEFRHESWLAEPVFQRLAEHGAALCIPESPHLPRALRLTANWTYLRFHQGARAGDYTAEQLAAWAKQIRAFLEQGVAVWAYFNNDERGYAVQNARELRARLVDPARGMSAAQ